MGEKKLLYVIIKQEHESMALTRFGQDSGTLLSGSALLESKELIRCVRDVQLIPELLDGAQIRIILLGSSASGCYHTTDTKESHRLRPLCVIGSDFFFFPC